MKNDKIYTKQLKSSFIIGKTKLRVVGFLQLYRLASRSSRQRSRIAKIWVGVDLKKFFIFAKKLNK